jgi:hypothetical protein
MQMARTGDAAVKDQMPEVRELLKTCRDFALIPAYIDIDCAASFYKNHKTL